jgi:putative redox protein
MSKCVVEYQETFSTNITSLDHQAKILTDAPKEHGGRGGNFSPTDLVGAALGSCILTIMGMHAKKMGVDFRGAKAEVTKNQGSTLGGIGELIVHVYYPHPLEGSICEKLEKAAMHCPVHHVLDSKVKQEIVFHWGEALTV